MALSKNIYSGKQWKVGIKPQAAFGTAIAVSAPFTQMPLMDVSLPSITSMEGGGMKAGAAGSGMLPHDGHFFRSEKGGEVTWSFEMPCELEWAAQMFGSVFQNVVQTDVSDDTVAPFVSTTTLNKDSSRPVWGTVASGLPAYYTIAFDSARAGEDFVMSDAILRTLTLSCDPSSNEGRCYLSGEFYSSKPLAREQTLSGAWTYRTQSYMYPDFVTRTLDVEGAAQDIFLSTFEVTVNNNASRLGMNADGSGEFFKWGVPELEITGSMRVKYDAEINTGAATNPMDDFLEGTSSTLKISNTTAFGTPAVAGEYSILARIMYTGTPELDLSSDDGVYFTLPYKVVQETSDSQGYIAADTGGGSFIYTVANSTLIANW
jgi:hypothetical protein